MTSEAERRLPLLARSRRARWLAPIFLLLLLALSVQRLCSVRAAPRVHAFAGATMGTTWSVRLVAGPLPRPARMAVSETIAGRLAVVEALMSTWDEDSELSRFNRWASTGPFRVSHHTLEVFRVAQEVSALTAGAFDVTVGPLVTAWGFGATDRAPGQPPPEELSALRERVGYRRLQIDVGAGTLAKSHPGVVCDLSAVAKGYAVDEVARSLRELGHRDFLVEVGGEVRAHGEREGGGPWRVAVERPDAAPGEVFRVVELRDSALATSGDYRNFVERDGVRLSHLLDPRLGRPVAHALASVSVADPSAARADALATGLAVLGPEQGLDLAEARGLAAYFVLREGGGSLRGVASSAFLGQFGGEDPRGGAEPPETNPSER